MSELSVSDATIQSLAQSLSQQLEEEVFRKKYAPAAAVLKLVGAGAFLAAYVAVPNLSRILTPLLANEKDYHAWKRFNIPYLKRTLERLEKEKFVRMNETGMLQTVELTDKGKQKIIQFTFEALNIKKPKHWQGIWWLVSYDIPRTSHRTRAVFRKYLCSWKFYPLHESVFLHAYPCEKEIRWLRNYLGIGKYVRIFTVTSIENDASFREFFGI